LEKKEAYKNILPHFQQPGQAYFVTFCLWNAVPHGALINYTNKLGEIKLQIEYRKRHHLYDQMLTELTKDYYQLRKRYIKAYDDLLAQRVDRTIDLNKTELAEIISKALTFWGGTRIDNYAWCIMPNHVHWVFKTRKTDTNGQPVYLSEIMESVKKHTAKEINRAIGRQGHFWQKESFDTTIRDDKHLYRAIEYTLNNPVTARYVNDRKDWLGSWGSGSL
jgi:REP element-mobilizing transposase RayT